MFYPQESTVPPQRPRLAEAPSQFLLLERGVEDEFLPLMCKELQRRVEQLAETVRATKPICQACRSRFEMATRATLSWHGHLQPSETSQPPSGPHILTHHAPVAGVWGRPTTASVDAH